VVKAVNLHVHIRAHIIRFHTTCWSFNRVVLFWTTLASLA